MSYFRALHRRAFCTCFGLRINGDGRHLVESDNSPCRICRQIQSTCIYLIEYSIQAPPCEGKGIFKLYQTDGVAAGYAFTLVIVKVLGTGEYPCRSHDISLAWPLDFYKTKK